MKKVILSCVILTLFVVSCKKEHKNTTVPDKKTYKVNFNVSGFTQTIANSLKNKTQVNSLKTDSVGLSVSMDQLYYYVFDPASKSQVHFISQDSTASNFGAISDNLPAGTYIVVIGAGKGGFLSYSQDNSGINNWFMYYGFTKQWSDTFYDKFQLTVSGEVNQNITLHRIVGKLEVDILDAIPPNANTISITVNQENFNFMIYPVEGLTNPGTLISVTTIPASAKGLANFKFDNIITNTATPFTVTINCYDAAQKNIGTAIVNDVTCQQNTRTILSGKLFGSDNGFNVSLGTWNPSTINIPF